MPVVYCPDRRDTEMASLIDSLAYFHKFTARYGGDRDLGTLDPNEPLYVLCHGHAEMPLFLLSSVDDGSGSKKKLTWSAAEFASLLVSDGLSHATTRLEMLVCHAGESVSYQDDARYLLALREKAGFVSDLNDRRLAALREKYSARVKRMEPSQPYVNERQTFPMAAQLYRELYSRGLMRLSIRAYQAPVCQAFGSSGSFEPMLDLRSKGGNYGVGASTVPQYSTLLTRKVFGLLGWSLASDHVKPNSCW